MVVRRTRHGLITLVELYSTLRLKTSTDTAGRTGLTQLPTVCLQRSHSQRWDVDARRWSQPRALFLPISNQPGDSVMVYCL
jgi:hypothetical protein